MKTFIKQLAQRKGLSSDECQQALEMMSQTLIPEQAGAFLSLLHVKPETSDEIAGFVSYLKANMHRIDSAKASLDIVGTGGDHSNTVNISSASALLCASLGVTTVKHGNRSVSSQCGSADFIKALGIEINLNPSQATFLLEKTDFTFLYAPNFHPVLLQFRALRQSLGIPTTFNLVGPLLNPANPDYLVLGVYHPRLLEIYADFLEKTDIKRALILHSCGLDEASLLGKTEVIEINRKQKTAYTLNPEEYGFRLCQLQAIQGGDAETNRKLVLDALSGESSAISDTIVLNSALGLYASQHCDSIQKGIAIAKEQIQSGKVVDTIKTISHYSKEAAQHA